jgi:hypothetical protein
MRWGPLLLCGWPGLTGLWYRGQLSSLLVAVGFSILLNLALVSSFLWPWALGETFPAVAWPTIFLIWGTSTWLAYHRLTDVMSVPSSEKVAVPERPDTLFIQAQREYLGGHWEEAETLLRLRIGRAPRDVEARLLLTTLLRHTRRLDESHEQLEEMLRFDESQEWEFEIDRERQLIDLITQHETAEQEMDPNEDNLNDGLPPNNDGFVRGLEPQTEPSSNGQFAIDSN